MITGIVTVNRHAVISLQLQGTSGQVNPEEALVDTGFDGFLTLPLQRIVSLGFPYEGTIKAVLGDGRETALDMFSGTIVWNGQERSVVVLAAEGSALVGMALLSGSRVTLEVEDGGLVTIEAL